MRFALPACKFEGLHLSHRFFYDLIFLLKAVCLNVAKEMEKKIMRQIWKAFTPEYLEQLFKSLPKQMAALIQSKGAYTNYQWISN